MSAVSSDQAQIPSESVYRGTAVRMCGWVIVTSTLVYILNNYLTVWLGFPGIFGITGENAGLAIVQLFILLAALAGVILFVMRTPARGLRPDAALMARMTNFIIRAAFWSVVLVGISDAFISFLRVEGLLSTLFGEEMAKDLGRSAYRGPFIHIPLVFVGILIATRTKTLGFQWLALLVVMAELFIVVSRFVFSYEQAFQGDLVRFWYGALFLFASAYTLFDDGHVRVDVVYAGFSPEMKGLINAIGSLVLGVSLCWVILGFGMWDNFSIINTSLLNYEVSQSGFGMYVKFWMSGFLAIFAVTMAIQFSSYLLEGIADYRGVPGRRVVAPSGSH